MNPLEARFAAWRDRRACGTCTACCHVFAVKAVASPQYTWCRECEVGVGCRIYDARPEECRGFYCLWRMGFGTEDDRPDRRGVVLDLQVEAGEALVIRVWRPRHPQERQRRSARRMQREIWEALTADGYGPVSIELHGPPPATIVRWTPEEERHGSGADAADSAERAWGATRGAGSAARAAGASAGATGGDDASGE
jgi:hypothetical protein